MASAVQVRRSGGGECRAVGRKIVGHASVFNRASRNLGGFIEIVLPHAFDSALSEGGNVQCRYNHASAFVIGSTDDGRLNLRADAIGLAYEVEPGPEHQWLLRAVERGDVTGSSFAFTMLRGGVDRWGVTEVGALLREIRSVGQLVDVAVVDVPAYPSAEAAVRSAPALRGGLDARTAMRIIDRRAIPPGPVSGYEVQRILERKWRPA